MDEQKEKQRLIEQMGSQERATALYAVEALREQGWLGDGSLVGVDLSRADLSAANLQGAKLWNANLQEAYLPNANLQGAYLPNANLQGAKLWNANLQEADLSFANLQGAELYAANLQGAYLIGANLQGADLERANLQGTNLRLANLQGTDLDAVSFNEKTRLPNGDNWEDSVDMARFSDPEHTEFWRSDHYTSPAYKAANDPDDPHYEEWQELWGNKE